jgi:uncharacterized protein YggU (UPF0235/DUF167 family)
MPEERKFEITDAKGGAAFAVRIIAEAEQAEIVGFQEDGILRVRLTSTSPGDATAEDELVSLLAAHLEVEKRFVAVVAANPKKPTEKMVSVEGLPRQVVEDRLMSGR